MEMTNLWETYTDEQFKAMEEVCAKYMDCLAKGKTEREVARISIEMAEKAGYRNIKEFNKLVAGDRVYAVYNEKEVILYHIGKDSMEKGMNILGAHIDSPRIDVKQNPLYETDGFAYLEIGRAHV